MKNRKTVLATVLALVLAFTSALSFSSCGESKKVYTVGICQLATHDALDAATRGFQDALKDKLGADIETKAKGQSSLFLAHRHLKSAASRISSTHFSSPSSPLSSARW